MHTWRCFVRDNNQSSVSFKQRIRLFTPAWFTIVMGTGAVTILFNVFPYGSSPQHQHALQLTALAFLILNIFFFILITSLVVARFFCFPELWKATLRHQTQGFFLACAPMGFATILIGAVDVAHGYFGIGGRGYLLAIWAMWWVDMAVSVVICFGQLHFMFTRQTHALPRMTMVWLLPIVTLIVGSAAGCTIALSLIPTSSSLSHVYVTLGACFLLVTIGITLSLAIITIYLLRLVIYKLPDGIAVFSVYLPLGPLSQAGFTYVLIGEVAAKVLPAPPSSTLLAASGSYNAIRDRSLGVLVNPLTGQGQVLSALTLVIGLALWSFATCWVVLAVLILTDVFVFKYRSGSGSGSGCRGTSRAPRLDRSLGKSRSTLHNGNELADNKDEGNNANANGSDIEDTSTSPSPNSPSRVPFKITYWGMTFPNGVYANVTIHLAGIINSQVLRVWGTICAVFTIGLWFLGFVRTVSALRGGEAFRELCEEVEEVEAESSADELDGSTVHIRSALSEEELQSTHSARCGDECARGLRRVQSSPV